MSDLTVLIERIQSEIDEARHDVSSHMPNPVTPPPTPLQGRLYWYGVGRVEALSDVLTWIKLRDPARPPRDEEVSDE